MSSPEKQHDSFRDSIATADQSGQRIWIYPNKPSGRFYTGRTVLSWFLIAFLFGAPFIKINGEPLLLFNIIERKFFIFGLAFWPQDLHLFVLATITFVVFIILFTAVFGRLFCGWVCPQTIFLEMLFRKIEYLIEGNGPKQRALDKAPWSGSKIYKKTLKHVIFFSLSFLIGNTFLAYIIGVDQLLPIVTASPSEHAVGFSFMIFFTLLFYGVFSRFREQACTIVCPYGRLQGVLLDENSIVVAYDHKRGEERGPAHRAQDFSERGHCIDCFACVNVCPTGIDIRNGTQLECVNCTACIDACDRVMDRIKLPRGLIRYSSGAAIERGEKFRLTPRIIGYSVVLTLLLVLMSFLMLTRKDIETTILRTRGTLYEEVENNVIRNLYNLRVINKTFNQRPIELRLKQPKGRIKTVVPTLTVEPDGQLESVFFVEIDKQNLFAANTLIVIGIYSGDEMIEEITTNFTGPNPAATRE